MSEQIIHFTIHAPAAANIQCSVRIASNFPSEPVHRCSESAVWGVVNPASGGTTYKLTAYCDRHFQLHQAQPECLSSGGDDDTSLPQR